MARFEDGALMNHTQVTKLATALILALVSVPAPAQLDYDLSNLQGYTVIGRKTIAGWYDNNGATGDGFEGCQFGRVIVFTDNRILTCRGYTYQYAYRPTAIILSNGASFKMVVGNTVYEMQR
ncbi:MAG TPA: hypothetical protein VF814_03875 [Casimicrobiaceae bacterium]